MELDKEIIDITNKVDLKNILDKDAKAFFADRDVYPADYMQNINMSIIAAGAHRIIIPGTGVKLWIVGNLAMYYIAKSNGVNLVSSKTSYDAKLNPLTIKMCKEFGNDDSLIIHLSDRIDPEFVKDFGIEMPEKLVGETPEVITLRFLPRLVKDNRSKFFGYKKSISELF